MNVQSVQALRYCVYSAYKKLRGLSLRATVPTERPPLVGEVSANVCGWRVPRGRRDGSLRPYFRLSRPEPLLFLPSSSSS
jgi:hypothetical protein